MEYSVEAIKPLPLPEIQYRYSVVGDSPLNGIASPKRTCVEYQRWRMAWLVGYAYALSGGRTSPP